MNIEKIIKAMLAINGQTSRSVSISLGKAHNFLNKIITRDDNSVTVRSLLTVLDAMDCDLVVVSRSHPEMAITVTPPDNADGAADSEEA